MYFLDPLFSYIILWWTFVTSTPDRSGRNSVSLVRFHGLRKNLGEAHLGEAECCPLRVKRVYGRWSSHLGQVGLDQRLAPLRLTTGTPPPRVAPISVNDNVLVKSFATSNCHRNHLVVIPRARYKLFIILQVFLSNDSLL